jgi:hypothetical protein
MPTLGTNDPRRRFVLDDPTGIEIDNVPYAEWLKAHNQSNAASAAIPSDTMPVPRPVTVAMADDAEPQADDRLVFFDFDLT